MCFVQGLQDLLATLRFEDDPAGSAVAVFYQGQCVAEAAVGQALPDQAWTADTLSLNFSVGKGVLATLVHVLVSQGVLDYDRPIAQVWHDFVQADKQAITLRQVLTHQSGLYDITSVTQSSLDMLDWVAMLEKVARMSVRSLAVKADYSYDSVYSALVFGWVVGGLIEQATGQNLQSVLEAYLLDPLDLVGSVFFGVPSSLVPKVAQPVRNFAMSVNSGQKIGKSTKPKLKPDSETRLQVYQSLPMAEAWQQALVKKFGDGRALNTSNINALYFDPSLMDVASYKRALIPNDKQDFDYYAPEVLQAVIPAANGVATAKALARIYALLAQGGVWQNQRLISEEVFAQLGRPYTQKRDKVMPATDPQSMAWRLGYHRGFSALHAIPAAFGHMGYNGASAWCDPEHNLAVAFVHNFDTTMLTDVRQFAITEWILQNRDQLKN